MKILKTLLTISFILTIASSCDNAEDTPPYNYNVEFYETGNDAFPIAIADAYENALSFRCDFKQLFIKHKTGEEWLYTFNDKGYLESIYTHKDDAADIMVLFSEFDGDKCNVALINQETGETNYLFDHEVTGMSNTQPLSYYQSQYPTKVNTRGASTGIEDAVSDFLNSYDVGYLHDSEFYLDMLKTTGWPAVQSGLCIKGIAATAATGGATAIPTALSCTATLMSISSDLIKENWDMGGALTNLGAAGGKFGETVFSCAQQNWTNCLMAFGGIISNSYNFYNNCEGNPQTQEAKENLANLTATGGLMGDWLYEEDGYSIKFNFLHTAGYEETTKETLSGGVKTVQTVKRIFAYTLNNNTLNVNYRNIQYSSKQYLNNSLIYSDEETLSWNDFYSKYNPGATIPSNIFTSNIEWSNYKQTLYITERMKSFDRQTN